MNDSQKILLLVWGAVHLLNFGALIKYWIKKKRFDFYMSPRYKDNVKENLQAMQAICGLIVIVDLMYLLWR